MGRLAQVTPLAPLFEGRAPPLTGDERAEHAAADRLIATFGGVHTDGLGVAFVGGLDEEQVLRRLGVDPDRWPVLDLVNDPGPYGTGPAGFDPYDHDTAKRYVGVTTVPGGCVLSQPMSFEVSHGGVLHPLSAGTVAAGMYFNPKGSKYGMVVRAGLAESRGEEIGMTPGPDSPREHWLYRFWQEGRDAPYGARELAYLAAAAGLRPEDATSVTRAPSFSQAPLGCLSGLGGSRGDGLLRSLAEGHGDTAAPGSAEAADRQQGDAP